MKSLLNNGLKASEVLELVDEYLRTFPEEAKAAAAFGEFAGSYDGGYLYDRKNPVGHITVSAIIGDRRMERFLLLWHRSLGRWLQPGGHVDASDAGLTDAVFREVLEETGLKRDELEIMSTPEGCIVLAIDSHLIPANPNKGEGEHYHHDLRILLRLKSDEVRVRTNTDESGDYKWVSRDELVASLNLPTMFGRLAKFTKVAH